MRTTAARLSALFLLLFTVCALILVVYMTQVSVSMLTAQTRGTINEEIASLDRAYQRGGLPLLVRLITQRSRQPGANLYLIAEPSGRILAGNVESLDPRILLTQGWTEVPFSYQRYGEGDRSQLPVGTETRHDAIAIVLQLPNGLRALVGRDLGEPERLRSVVQRALLLSVGLMAVTGLLIWLVVGRRALRRIDHLSEAGRQIMAGDLSRRLPVSGSGDEFDRLAESLNAMIGRIGELNEGLKQVSDNIAHDLKTPLTRLRNRAEAALAGGEGAGDHREALEATIHNSDQLIRTFNSILMISRLEAGQSTAEASAPVDLGASVRDVIELYDAVAEEAGVALELEAESPIVVEGNRELIGQALANLIDNAIKYAGGEEVAAPRVRVRLGEEGGEAVIEVSDNGPGIPDDADRERATERFVRLEKSRSQPGSGLGLSIVRAVMKFHGGRLELLPGAPGLRALMRFPLRAQPA
ncbi:MAG: two-component sensor histidine kinase [Mesorhizobium amorphae]|nr:MAG: two-component sensor histidine kinase [Mesorhizobium amorphae]